MTNNEKDKERIAQKAISHLAEHGLGCVWELGGDPSPDVALLVISYIVGGETAKELEDINCHYLMWRITQDHPGLKVPSSPGGVVA
jgi:hypothetical protein